MLVVQNQMDALTGAYLDTMCTVKRLLQQPDLLDFVQDGCGGEDEEADLIDLISGDLFNEIVGTVRDTLQQAFDQAELFKTMYNPFR